MSLSEDKDENHPPSGSTMSPQKPRPLGFYVKSSKDNFDLKATISGPYGFSMGNVGLGIAEGMALRHSNRSNALDIPPFPHNLVLAKHSPQSLALKDDLLAARRANVSVGAGRRRAVLHKPPTKSRNPSPPRCRTKSKVVHQVAGIKTRNIRTSYTPPVRKRGSKLAGTDCHNPADTDRFCRLDSSGISPPSRSSLLPAQRSPSVAIQSIFCNSGLAETNAATPPVSSLPTTAMIHPSADQYESLPKSVPSLEALVRSDPFYEFEYPSFGSVKPRAKGADTFFTNISACPPAMPDSVASTQGTKGNLPVALSPNTEAQSSTGLCRTVPEFATFSKLSFLTPSPLLLRARSRKDQSLGPTSLSTTALNVSGTQTEDCPSLLCPAETLQDLAEKTSYVEISAPSNDQRPASTFCLDSEDTRNMSFGSVKPRSNFRASIATSKIRPGMSQQSMLLCESINDSFYFNDSSLSSDESPSSPDPNKSIVVEFNHHSSIQEDFAKNKHERLLAAILDTVPSSPDVSDISLPSILVTKEGDRRSLTSPDTSLSASTSCQQDIRRSVTFCVPEIVVTSSAEDADRGILSSSSTFSIIDLYVGRPEMPCLGPQRNRTNDTTFLLGRPLESSRISKVNVLRDSVSYPGATTNQRLSVLVDTASVTSGLDKRSSFLPPGMPSSFLSMSAVNEDGEGKRAMHGSGLKAFFRRSVSKGSLVGNSGESRPQSSISTSSRRNVDARRVSGWGFFKWMKG